MGETSEVRFSDTEMVKQLWLSVNHTRCDVRLSTGEVMGNKTPAHASVKALWWQWKQLFNVKLNSQSHINFLEMKMILNTLLWKARFPSKINKRWLHLEDSMVCLFFSTKGRTSSVMLQPICNKIGALQLAMGSILLHEHVTSCENPIDAASRL